ncbi:MAG: hypothetical protein JSV79_01540 [Armatimonadota bacterium]|nr:MAG: hypothetical protein JSV79_01540 [Armatimonadota bacterium]
MQTSLLSVLVCPICRGELEIPAPVVVTELREGELRCKACGSTCDIEDGVAILGSRRELGRYADRWPAGLTHESLLSNIEQRRAEYAAGGPFAEWVDAAACTRGTVVDIATGPGSSLLGALVPLLTEETHLVLADASLYLLPRLKAAWATQAPRPVMDFIAMDANRMPFRDGVLDGITSRFGFGGVWDDPARSKPPRCGHAYRGAYRALKARASIFELCLLFAAESGTAAMLEHEGCINASQDSLESFWRALGFEIEWAREVHKGRGKLHPGDLVPIDERDKWREMAYVLRKPS